MFASHRSSFLITSSTEIAPSLHRERSISLPNPSHATPCQSKPSSPTSAATPSNSFASTNSSNSSNSSDSSSSSNSSPSTPSRVQRYSSFDSSVSSSTGFGPTSNYANQSGPGKISIGSRRNPVESAEVATEPRTKDEKPRSIRRSMGAHRSGDSLITAFNSPPPIAIPPPPPTVMHPNFSPPSARRDPVVPSSPTTNPLAFSAPPTSPKRSGRMESKEEGFITRLLKVLARAEKATASEIGLPSFVQHLSHIGLSDRGYETVNLPPDMKAIFEELDARLKSTDAKTNKDAHAMLNSLLIAFGVQGESRTSPRNPARNPPPSSVMIANEELRMLYLQISKLENVVEKSKVTINQQRNRLAQLENLTANEHLRINPQDLVMGDQLGGGTFGAVHKAVWKGRGGISEVAVKRIRVQGNETLDEIFHEVETMAVLRFPHICQVHGGCIIRETNEVWIVMQLVNGNDLKNFLNGSPLRQDLQYKFFDQAAKAVNYLHTAHAPILHRDIKSLNFLVHDGNTLLLTDFGTAKAKAQVNLTGAGTVAWMAPEVLRSTPQWSEKADIYGLGMTFYEMVSGLTPFYGDGNLFSLRAKITKGERPAIPESCPKELADVIRQCWHPDPKERPTSQELLDMLHKLRGTNSNSDSFLGKPR